MKKEVKILYNKAIDSLILGIEIFNRPSDSARVHGTLIFIDHAFEMLLKACIIHKGGKIQSPRDGNTIGFTACLNLSLNNAKLSHLTKEEYLTLQSLNSLRDAAQHYILDISEQQLYLHAQAGLTLFRDIVRNIFKIELKDKLPVRVLPMSTVPPIEIHALFSNEVDEIKKLLWPSRRKSNETYDKLRPLAIVEQAIQGINVQPSKKDLSNLLQSLEAGMSWQEVFPGVSSLTFTQNGYGPKLDLRLNKTTGIPITIVPEGTPGAEVVVLKRVNEDSYYSLTFTQLNTKFKTIGANKFHALIKELNIRNDPEAYSERKFGKTVIKLFSAKAIKLIEKALPSLDIDEIWEKHRPVSGGRKSRKRN